MENNNPTNPDQNPQFPMRINKYLAQARQSSRREMDKVIAEGKVMINGRVAVLGDKVNEGDRIEVRFRGFKEKEEGNSFAAKRHNQKQRRG